MAASWIYRSCMKLLQHFFPACLLITICCSPLKNGGHRLATIQTVSVAIVALGLEVAHATSMEDVPSTTQATVAGRQYDLRLVGFTNVTNEGLLQVYMDNRWGWVYSFRDAYREKVAEVACEQMGYAQCSTDIKTVLKSFSRNSNKKFNSTIPWLMARVKCSGYESRLVDCGHVNFTSTIPVTEDTYHVALKCVGMATSRNNSVQVRLNGTSSLSGLLQLKKAPYNGWLPFCGYSMDMRAAHVICREEGHTHALGIDHVLNPDSTTSVSHAVTSIDCLGFEKSVSECAVSVESMTSQCLRMRVDVNISCSDEVLPPLGSELRIDSKHRVQVRYSGFWNYLISGVLYPHNAQAACLQYKGQNLSKWWVTKETDLDPILPFRFLCNHGNVANLMECVPVEIPPGTTTDTVLHAVCDAGPPKFGALRIVSTKDPKKGRIEIYGNNSQWGTICDDYWTNQDATVACRQLGLGVMGISKGMAMYGQGTGPILLDDVRCTGFEETLLECRSSPLGEHNCVHSEDAGIECFDRMPTLPPDEEWKVSLVGGSSPNSGTIQLQIGDQIGTICDDHFGRSDGQVICRMLGYPFVKNVHGSAKFGQGKGEILLDDLQCLGTESSLKDCFYLQIGTHNCMHHEDAGVTCTSDPAGPSWTDIPPFVDPTKSGLPSSLGMGIGSATIMITLLVVMCVGCMFCACIMRRLRVNSNIENVNNNRESSYSMVNQRENTPTSANSVPPSYTDVLSHPTEYSQVNAASPEGIAIPPQSPPPNSPPPSYARTFEVGNNTLRVVTITDPSSQGEQTVHREPIPIPLSPPPSYDDAAPVFPSSPEENRPTLPDVVTVSAEVNERNALTGSPEESDHTTTV